MDKFAADTPVGTKAGDSFQIDFPFEDGDTKGLRSKSSAYFTYANGVLRLILSLDDPPRLFSRHGDYRIAFIGGRIGGNGSYIGQNGFGAAAQVRSLSVDRYGLAFLQHPQADDFPGDPDHPEFDMSLAPDQRNTYWVGLPLDGASARRMTSSAIVRLSGQFAILPNGKLTDCDSSSSDATIDNPEDIIVYSCWAGAKIDSVSIIDKTGNVTLKSWQ